LRDLLSLSKVKVLKYGKTHIEFTYLGTPINADFELSYESLAPYVTKVLDLAAPLEGAGLTVRLVEIKGGIVKVW
jgi:hypothetical protein